MSSQIISIVYSQFHLVPPGGALIFDPARPAPLAQVSADGCGLIVLTGIAMGPVIVIIATGTLVESPGVQWEEQQVVTMCIDQELYLDSLSDDPEEFGDIGNPAFVPTALGQYAVTILASGRETDRDGIREDPCEKYFVSIVPA